LAEVFSFLSGLYFRGKVTYARTGMLEADLPNKQILMHLYGARYQERDPKDPFDLHKIHDVQGSGAATPIPARR